jgi:nucleoside-diphosphate-sugar epimerase
MTRDTAQSIPSSTTTKILLDNVDYDTTGGSLADATTNNRFDIVADGVYLVSASWGIPSALDDNENLSARIYVNGTMTMYQVARSTGTNVFVYVEAVDTYELSAGDYIEFYVEQTEGADQDTSTDVALKPRMSVTQLAPSY